jgi:hypothetical protein
MKSFITGLLTILAIGIIGFITFRSTTSFMIKIFGSPSPSAYVFPSESPVASSTTKASSTPEESETPVKTTKGGMPIEDTKVKGATTYAPSTKTIVTTTTHLTLTLIKSSVCPVSYITEVKDISGPLSLKYVLKDGYSFGITVWKRDGSEIIQNTTYSGNSGLVKTVDGIDYMKVRIESKSCSGNSDNWLTLTAER